ncbi:MAG: AbrB/MazE/SpoVT family DNA-binding domain-containing protein [Chloroflexi bacterium]|nr:AbrB/MazE/SpoVT family DNA-binding domain-containing protein [Chloroflexota bacterium]
MATVGERYQVVIERDVRRELSVKPGDRAVETVENGRLVITFLPPRHGRSLRGRLRSGQGVDDMAVLRDGRAIADGIAEEHRPDQC